MKIFFSVGEPSGDLHGANLIRRLRGLDSDLTAVGYGGPKMAKVGCRLHEDMTQFAVMWIVPVILNLHKFWGLATRADRYFRHQRPDAVVLIDYPGFNWWIARRAKAHGIPVFYYGAPQMWAWAGWRVNKMRRLVDHVLCKLPFEAVWYQRRGCNATFVGHPYFDEMQSQKRDESFQREYSAQPGRLVTILPGSRTQEVEKNLRCFVRAAEIIKRHVPDARFAVAGYKDKHLDFIRQLVGSSAVPIDVFVGRTPELIHLAHSCMACSGSVSLELLYHEKPTVIYYRIGQLTFRIMKSLGVIKVRFITLVNLLSVDEPFAHRPEPYDPQAPGAEDVPFPEYPTYEDRSEQVAQHMVDWLTDDVEYERRVAQLKSLKAEVAHGGASRRAAEYIARHVMAKSTVPRPHFARTSPPLELPTDIAVATDGS